MTRAAPLGCATAVGHSPNRSPRSMRTGAPKPDALARTISAPSGAQRTTSPGAPVALRQRAGFLTGWAGSSANGAASAAAAGVSRNSTSASRSMVATLRALRDAGQSVSHPELLCRRRSLGDADDGDPALEDVGAVDQVELDVA